MEVGHPVTTENGSHGIIMQKHKDGTTMVNLIGGATLRAKHTSLKSYFDNTMPEGDMDVITRPDAVQGTRAQILTIIKAAGDVRLSADDIYSRGSFAGKAQLANELYALYRKHAVLGREKYDAATTGRAVYKYWLVPGAKLPESLKKDVREAVRPLSIKPPGIVIPVFGRHPDDRSGELPTKPVEKDRDADMATLVKRAQINISVSGNEKHNLATLKDLFARRAAIDAAIVALKKVMYWDDEATHG